MTDAFTRLAAALSDRYHIERELGEGGMATVYLAEDLKHNRKVAIKVLKPELASVLGADRFVQEIATTASLQHPNILPLFDSGSAQGFLYYVMPYVEGETLRARLDRERQLGVDEAVTLVVEVADALEYAHEQGVVHRDIKPENILLHAGRPMVADFGIALAVSAAAGGRMTETGLSLGTPHYMSPEQATAEKDITRRSDIYSLGSVLYEMLTGDPPHTGRSAQQIIAKIIAEDARPAEEVRRSVPPNVAAALSKALEKLPADRFETAKAFADALLDPNFTGPRVPALGVDTAGSRLARFALIGVSTVAAVATALTLWGWLRPTAPGPVTRYETSLGVHRWIDGGTLRVQAAISPDGSAIVFALPDSLGGESRLLIKRRAEWAPHPLAGTEDAKGPFFSPDGAWIGFFQRGKLVKVPATGGNPVSIADSAYAGPAVSGVWLDDGTIVFTDEAMELRRVSSDGGTSRVVAERPGRLRVFTFLAPLPGSRGVLFTGLRFQGDPVHTATYVWDARRDSVRLLIDNALGALYASTGHVLYMSRDGTLLAAPWDNDALRITGPAVPVLEGVQAPGFLLSRSGTALYSVGPPSFGVGGAPDAEAVWVDRHGHVEPVDTTWRFSTGTLSGVALSLSPDGRRLAIQLSTDQGNDIWIKQLPSGPAAPLTFYQGQDGGPGWTPDGRRVTFKSDRPVPGSPVGSVRYTLWSRPSDGSGQAALVWRGRQDIDRGFWSPDKRWLILQTGPGNLDILAARPGIDSVARPLEATPYDERGPALSPDGRWLAYVSDETGTNQVYVTPFPEADRNWQISTSGGSGPLWAHHGHELFYVSGDNLMSVQIHPGPPFSVGERRVLFARPPGIRPWTQDANGFMDVSPDDRRFIMVRNVHPAASLTPPTLVVVENFLEELRAKVKKR